MSKKTLLNEATVRRFMKLANVGALSNGFINEVGGMYGARDEDEFPDPEEEEEEEEGGLDVPLGDEPEVDLPGEDDEPLEDEPDLPGEEDASEVEITEDDRAALAAAIPVLEKIAGTAEDLGGEDLGGEELMEPEEEMMEGGNPFGKAEDLDEVELIDEKDLVQEVTRRVANRLRAVLKKRK